MFKNIEFPRNGKTMILRYVRDIVSARMSNGLNYKRVNKVELLLCWERPKAGFVKLNTDGSNKGMRGRAGTGGLLCNKEGRWLSGCMANVGYSDSLAAEIWAAIFGLQMA